MAFVHARLVCYTCHVQFLYSRGLTLEENLSLSLSLSLSLPLSLCRPLHGPLFFLDLVLDSQGSHYSQTLSSYQPTLTAIFDRGISSTHSVPMVEKVRERVYVHTCMSKKKHQHFYPTLPYPTLLSLYSTLQCIFTMYICIMCT